MVLFRVHEGRGTRLQELHAHLTFKAHHSTVEPCIVVPVTSPMLFIQRLPSFRCADTAPMDADRTAALDGEPRASWLTMNEETKMEGDARGHRAGDIAIPGRRCQAWRCESCSSVELRCCSFQ